MLPLRAGEGEQGSGNPRFGVSPEREMSAKVEGGEAFSRALSAELWALLPPLLLLSEPKTWPGRPEA